MEKTLYFECATGISGDMTVAALLDLGADRAALERALGSLPVDGFRTEITRVKKAGLDVCDFNVVLDTDNHDHDMAYLHGHEHHEHDHAHGEHTHEHHEHDHAHGEHTHEHHEHDHTHGEHTREHDHGPHEHHHAHAHRGLPEILHILEHADLTEGARALAVRVFRVLAAAEAKAHGVPENEVHFHEVGAVDSIVDIVAAAVCMDALGVTGCIFPSITEGTGSVRCQHGILPVPVPATLNIAQAHGLPLAVSPMQGELVTPTGAAIAAAVMTDTRLPKRFRVVRTGMGAGKRRYERPSILRVMEIEPLDEDGGTVVKLECNIDDCTGEALGYAMERLFEAGARDVHYTPVYMKKNRPGWLLTVICTEKQRTALERIIFAETTTIGIRRQTMERTVLHRRVERVQTSLGEVEVKVCEGEGVTRRYLEYESVAKLAQTLGQPFPELSRRLAQEVER